MDLLVNFLDKGKNNYANSGIFYAWFLAPRTKYCLVIDDFGVISAERTFKGYSKEHGMTKLNEIISLSEGKTYSERFSIDWTELIEGIKIPHQKPGCLDCKNELICGEFIKKSKLSFFNCEMERARETFLDQTVQRKTYSIDVSMLKKPAIDCYQMLPHYIGENKPRQNNNDFESAKEVLLEADKRLVEKRLFERILIEMESMAYTKYENRPENKENFIYGFKRIKTDKVDKYFLIGCDSNELYEND